MWNVTKGENSFEIAIDLLVANDKVSGALECGFEIHQRFKYSLEDVLWIWELYGFFLFFYLFI